MLNFALILSFEVLFFFILIPLIIYTLILTSAVLNDKKIQKYLSKNYNLKQLKNPNIVSKEDERVNNYSLKYIDAFYFVLKLMWKQPIVQ